MNLYSNMSGVVFILYFFLDFNEFFLNLEKIVEYLVCGIYFYFGLFIVSVL